MKSRRWTHAGAPAGPAAGGWPACALLLLWTALPAVAVAAAGVGTDASAVGPDASGVGPATSGAGAHAEGAGPVVLTGGVLRYDNDVVWRRLVALAGGRDARFEVLPVATGRADIYGGFAVKALEARGASAGLLPIADDPSTFGRDGRAAARDPALVDRILTADAVFFTGGAPQRVARSLLDEGGGPTPVLEAILALHAGGGLVAGANAGDRVVATGLPAWEALASGVPAGALQPGLGLLSDRWLFDQHFFTHARIGVALAALRALPGRRAIGIGVDSALVVRGHQAEVVGTPGAVVLGPVTVHELAPDQALRDIRLSYLAHGDRLNLASGEVTPSPAKRSGFAIHPHAAGHTPWFAGPSFHPDPFRSEAMVSLIFQAFDGPSGEAIGLVGHDQPRAGGDGATFRFRFFPGPDTRGWLSAAGGAPDYTVLDLHLDVQRIPAGDATPAGHTLGQPAGGARSR